MPDYYFHYTSREAAQSIGAIGVLEPGRAGVIYLTLDVYSHGTAAVNALGLGGKPIDVICVVPGNLIEGQPAIGVAFPYNDPVTGRIGPRGGGSQVEVPGPLMAGDIRWFALGQP